MMRRTLLRGKDLDLLVVCAPCQPFSSQNQKRKGDRRARLLLQSVRFARALRPKVILFENVPGLAGKQHNHLLERLRGQLARIGYTVSAPVNVDAADFGVPQRRRRCILIAGLPGVPELPAPLTPAGKRVTVRQAISDLARLGSGKRDPNDGLHFARSHRSIALRRLKHIPQDGGDRFSLPPRMRLACHAGHTGHPDVYGRMRWDDIAPTLTTGCTDITRGRFAHPRDNRAITLREAARLQTFPDDYRFFGNPRQVAAQIGNAVPIRLIEALTPVLRRALGS